jgi:hypothetical protein
MVGLRREGEATTRHHNKGVVGTRVSYGTVVPTLSRENFEKGEEPGDFSNDILGRPTSTTWVTS